jgi:hypothetical protein
MAKSDPSSSLSPFQRFEKLGKALFAVPKKAIEGKTEVRKRAKRRKSSQRTA